MRRNYAQTNRGTAKPRAGAGRRTQTESYGSAGRGSRTGARRMSQQNNGSSQGMVIGLLIACAVIVLIVVVYAASGSEGNDLEGKLTDEQPEKQQPNTETADIVSGKSTDTSEDPVISIPKKNDDVLEDEFDDDDDWSTKDPDFKGKNLGNRDKFKK